MGLRISWHARQRLQERLGSARIDPSLMSRLEDASRAGASGVVVGRWLFVLANHVLVTVRPKRWARGNNAAD